MNSIKSQLIVGVISTFCIFVSEHTSAQGHHHASNQVNISIDKKIVFLGKDLPVLDGEKKHEVLSIHADSVVVDGFKIIKSSYATITDPCGIKVYNKSYVIIQNNVLDDNFFGIYLNLNI